MIGLLWQVRDRLEACPTLVPVNLLATFIASFRSEPVLLHHSSLASFLVFMVIRSSAFLFVLSALFCG